MAESINAVQNISEDFGWFPNVLIALFALFLGVIASLVIWRRQTLLSHDLVERDEKRAIYRQFLRQLNVAFLRMDPDADIRENEEYMELYRILYEIQLVSSQTLHDLAFKAITSIHEASKHEYSEEFECSDGEFRDATRRMHFETRKFVSAAKLELEK